MIFASSTGRTERTIAIDTAANIAISRLLELDCRHDCSYQLDLTRISSANWEIDETVGLDRRRRFDEIVYWNISSQLSWIYLLFMF